MKTIIALFSALAIVIAAVAIADEPAHETPWFDMPNCDFCKHLTTDPHLLENMTWEHHNISNGALSITAVKPEFRDSYMKAETAMMELGEKMEKGEVQMSDVKMCGSCMAYGALMAAGAKFEYVPGDAAIVVLMTSDNPEVVKQIQAYAAKNREEMAKWETAEEMK